MDYNFDISVIITFPKKISISCQMLNSLLRSVIYASSLKIEVIVLIDSDQSLIFEKFLPLMNLKVKKVDLSCEKKAKSLELSLASGKYTLMLADNVVICENWLEKAHNFYENLDKEAALFPEYNVMYGREKAVFHNCNDSVENNPIANSIRRNILECSCFIKSETLLRYACDTKAAENIAYYTVPETVFFNKTTCDDSIESYSLNPYMRRTNLEFNDNNLQNFIEANKNKRICFYGAGIFARDFFKMQDLSGLNIIGIIDKDSSKNGSKIENYTILSIDDLDELKPDMVILSVLDWKMVIESVLNILAKKNIKAKIVCNLNNLPGNNEEKSSPFKYFSEWLVSECRKIDNIEPMIFNTETQDQLYPIYKIPTGYVDKAYDQILSLIDNDITHLVLVNWLQRTGADLLTINYLKALKNLGQKVAIISTLNKESPWKDRIPEGFTFIELGKAYAHMEFELQENLLLKLIEAISPKTIHNINSGLFYSLLRKKGEQLKDKINIFTSVFSVEYTKSGFYTGYHFEHLPNCFEFLKGVITENKNFINILHNMYGFEKEKMICQYQPITINHKKPYTKNLKENKIMNILWASRIDTQKRPDILIEIAKKSIGKPFIFHVYGSALLSTNNYLQELEKLPNVKLYGVYDNFFSLPLELYDVFLYTSQWDGMPNVLLEAISVGLPIIASNVGGISELIHDQKTGFLIDPYDDPNKYLECLINIYENSAILGNIVENAYDLVMTQHSWDAFLSDIENCFDYMGNKLLISNK